MIKDASEVSGAVIKEQVKRVVVNNVNIKAVLHKERTNGARTKQNMF
jgi:hypothetical protein